MIYHVYANQSNVGDWLSAQGIRALLEPSPMQECLCDEPFVPQTLQTLSLARSEDMILVGGGGLLMDYFEPFWTGLLPIAARVPLVLWGLGVCDSKQHHTSLPERLIASILRHCRLCVVRDELTRTHLQAWHLPPPVPCPTTVAVGPRAGARSILLHVDHLDLVGATAYQKMVAGAGEFARRTGRSYRQTNNRIPPRSTSSLEATLALYASSDLVLSSRLHGCIIALAMGRPVLAVSGDHKIESFMRAANLSEWVCELDQIDSLPERLADLPRQPSAAHFIELARSQNRQVAEQVRQLARVHRALPSQP
jgi:polysaccharide pyruvyl transferase WcaK-like protein